MNTTQDKIEILSIALLERNPAQVAALKKLGHQLNIQLGWHYLLDLTWILENLGDPRGQSLMDAGAGKGLLQWYLLEQGAARIVSVDRLDRSELVLSKRARYAVSGMRASDLKPPTAVIQKNVHLASGGQKIVSLVRGVGSLVLIALPKTFPGRLVFYNQDLTNMPEVADNSLDAVVAVSSLEHNTPENLQKVVVEIMRKLKPGGRLLATLGAARGKDWLHEPSQGWNYTDESLRRIFTLAPGAASNYDQYDQLFAALKNCAELRDNLAPFYFRSGSNGMPWGKWDPQYQPVGVCKIKSADRGS